MNVPAGPEPADVARPFHLVRDHTRPQPRASIVADGVLWPDGSASIRWRGLRPCVEFWDRFDDAWADHGHGTARIEWATGERNHLARQAADTIDERDAALANYDTARDDLAAKSAEFDQATTWLALIAEGSCENYARGPGGCTRIRDRYASARYAADRWCDPCRAWAALNDVPMSTRPAGEGP